MLDALMRHRRALHAMPEIGYDLPKTRSYLLGQLEPLSVAIETAAESGVLAFFDGGKPDTVAFRADMDALRVEEPPGCAFRSQHPGRMHACGHDAHMALLLTFAQWVEESLASLPSNVLLIFQPAEESGGGAERIVATGALERYRVRRIYATHVQPAIAEGVLASRPGPLMPAASEIHARFHGASAHVARLGEGRDALAAGVAFAHALAAYERALPEDLPRLLRLCSMRAGSSTNVVPDLCEIGGTVRAFSREDHLSFKEAIARIAEEAAAPLGVRAEVSFTPAYPPLRNDAEAYHIFRTAIQGLPYEELSRPDLIAEDFSFYLERVPGMMFYVGLGTPAALHSPLFALNERALLSALEAYKRLAAFA